MQLIIQPEAGIAPVVRAIRKAKTSLSTLPQSEASDALRALHGLADFVIHRDR